MKAKEQLKEIMASKELRIKASRYSPILFLMIYLPHWCRNPFAEFHKDFEADLYDPDVKNLMLATFRESAKTSFAIADALSRICHKKNNFMIIASNEIKAAKNILSIIINELQTNSLILNDFGQLYFEDDSNKKLSKRKTQDDLITANDIRIMARGMGQKVRGSIHKGYRPDYALMDDMESILSVREEDQRNKTQNWIEMEVIPAMDRTNYKCILLANVIHTDGLAFRFKAKSSWKTHWVKLFDDQGRFAWSARWRHTIQEAKEWNKSHKRQVSSVEEVKELIGHHAFNQEYMLKPHRQSDALIFEEWIQIERYDVPSLLRGSRYELAWSVDAAVSEKTSADYWACIVMLKDLDTNKKYVIHHFRTKGSMDEMCSKIHDVQNMFKDWGLPPLIMENVAQMGYLIQTLEKHWGVRVKRIPRINSKFGRLYDATPALSRGEVYFLPEQQIIIDELLNFDPTGKSGFDDLTDCFADCIHALDKVAGYKYGRI